MTVYGPNSGGVTYTVTANSGLQTGTSTVVITDASGSQTFTGVPNGTTGLANLTGANNIITGNNGTLSIASAILGSTYFVVPGANGTITTVAGLPSLTDNTIYVGGTATINTGATLLSGTTLDVDGGTATLANGIAATALSGTTVNLTDGGTFSNGSGLVSLLSGTTVNYGTGGGTFVANAGGAVLDLSGTTINGFEQNNGLNNLEFEGLSGTVSAYTISTSGGSQTITLLGANGTSIGSVTVAGTSLTAGTYTLGQPGPLSVGQSGSTVVVNDSASVCFLAGTRIRTVAGDIAVEDIKVGDAVVAWVDGAEELRPVTWVGQGRVVANANQPLDMSGYPVRVRQNAIADGVPCKDLLVTSEHCFHFDGHLVPARMLVNGGSIFYDRSIPSYDYYHFECADHSIVYADGALSETYLDTGNRRRFIEQRGVVPFPGGWKDAPMAAPLAVDRETVEPVWQALSQRAKQLGLEIETVSGTKIDDPAFHVVTDLGFTVGAVRHADASYSFLLPAKTQTVRFVSRSARLSETIGPFVDDRRKLGVKIGKIELWHDRRGVVVIDQHLTSASLQGWHEIEAAADGSRTRWTDGNGLLTLDVGEVGLLIVDVVDTISYGEDQQSEPSVAALALAG